MTCFMGKNRGIRSANAINQLNNNTNQKLENIVSTIKIDILHVSFGPINIKSAGVYLI